MLRDDIAKVVEDALREVQELGGHAWVKPASDAKVIGALEGFDSLTAIEATVLFEQKLASKFGIPEDFSLGHSSIFVSRDGRKALSTDEVVTNLCRNLEGRA